MMKSRPLQIAMLISLLTALLSAASGLAAQEATPDFPLTATWLADGGKLGNATLTPLPSLTPGAGGAPATRAQATVPVTAGPSMTPWPSSTPLPSLTPGAGSVPATVAPTDAPAAITSSVTPLPSLTPGPRATLTALPSLTPGGQVAATQAATELPAATWTLAPSLTPLPSLTPGTGAQVIVTQAATELPAATWTPAPSLTPLPSLTPSAGGATGGETAAGGGETTLAEGAATPAETQTASDLAAIRIVVPSVSLAQEAPPAPETAAGLGTLILLMGLGGATVIGLLMLARDRFRDHSDEPANQE